MKQYLRFRFLFGIGTLFLSLILFSSCGDKLSEKRAAELVRLNYRQQSTAEGAGNWLVDSVWVISISKLRKDTVQSFKVIAVANGLYQFPVAEGTPAGYTEKFLDTLQFLATQNGKSWTAEDWTVIGSTNQ